MPCWLTGHSVACVLAIAASIAVLYRFQQRLLQMRKGKDPYKDMLDDTPITSFSDSSTPALGGMVNSPLSPFRLPIPTPLTAACSG